MDPNDSTTNTPHKNKTKLSLDLRIIVVLLLAVIAAMLFMWKPWGSSTSDRTVEVTGETTLKAEPDEFVFYPSYQFKNPSKDTALAELSKKSEAVITKLKELGVTDSNIKTNSNGYDYPVSIEDGSGEVITYTLQLTVTVDNRELAQKVQDYLLTTAPTGAVSPQASFSEAKRKELENKARDEAAKDARSKAEKSAQNLGFKLGSVKSVKDGLGFDGVIPLGAPDAVTADGAESRLTIQPGENDLTYSVTVVYFIR